MAFGNGVAGWRRFLGLSQNKPHKPIDVLRQQYVDHMQQAARLALHAAKMHYPQFREKLLEIGNDKKNSAELIAQRLVAMGGTLPAVPEVLSSDENSWKQLGNALEEESRSADRLEAQLRSIESDQPETIALIQQICREHKTHRDAIRHMLMRSDPFAGSLA
ncbi:MAG TPA: ferritin-like domain-containing protein [Candidatus Binatia bacterium]|nr:ferritin-like domain-containing protein [Candidatus Binatia bacterium]